MKKIVLLLSLVLCAAVSFAQSGYVNTTTTGSATTLFKSKGYLGSDSAFILLQNVADTTTANFSGASLYNGAFIRVGTSIYYRTLSPKKWNLFATGSIPDQFNPAAGYAITLSGTYPNITFTVDTGLVVPYTDTLKLYGIATKSNVNLKVNISDTAAMLSNLLRKSDTLTMLSGYARTGNVVPNTRTINTNAPLVGGGDLSSDRTFLIDTGRANAEVVTGGSLNKVRDSLQANITASVSGVSSVSTTDNYGISSSVANPTSTPNISIGVDTSLIIPYTDTLKINGIATKTDINNARTGGTVTSVSAGVGMNFTTITTTGSVDADTLVLATRLHVDSVAMRKLNITDTSTMLSNLLRKTDTSTMLLPYLRKTDTALMLTGYTRVQRFLDTTSTLRTLINTKSDGTVKSVGLSMPAIFNISNSPVTTTGTLTATLANQNANLVWASPISGSPAQPTFRSLVAADIPDLSSIYLPIIDTATMLSNYNSGVGYGLIKNEKSPYVDTSLIISYTDTLKINGIATKTDIINNSPGNNYIKNQTSQQSSSNFNIDGTGIANQLTSSTNVKAIAEGSGDSYLFRGTKSNGTTDIVTLNQTGTGDGALSISNSSGTQTILYNGGGVNFVNTGFPLLINKTIDDSLHHWLQVTGTAYADTLASSTTINSIVKSDVNGHLLSAISGTDYLSPADSLMGGYTTWLLTKKKIDSLAYALSGTGYIPYIGATDSADLGDYNLTVYGIKIGRGAGNVPQNTVLGKLALTQNTFGAQNVAIGLQSLQQNIVGNNNTGVGTYTLSENLSSFNTAIGAYSLIANTSGYENTSLGYNNLKDVNDGYSNTSIGNKSGSGLIHGSNNTFIGANIGYPVPLDSLLNNHIIISTGDGVSKLLYDSIKWTSSSIINYNASNYESLFTDSTLVTKKYVDSLISSGGSGTVTSIATNNASGITGGTITTSGTLSIDTSSVISTKLNVLNQLNKYTGTSNTITVGTISTGTWQGTPIADSYISSASTWNAKQPQLNGTGFVKASGTTISYDNSTYLTTSSAASTYMPKSGGTFTGDVNMGANVIKTESGGYFRAENGTDYVTHSGLGFVWHQGGTYSISLLATTPTANRTITLPDATGTVALTSDIPSLSGYVPYTGATGSVNLGSNSLTASSFTGAGTGLTGTASSLSIGGTAGSETLATVTGRGASTTANISTGNITAGGTLSLVSNIYGSTNATVAIFRGADVAYGTNAYGSINIVSEAANYYQGAITFLTSSNINSTPPSEKARITSGGNVLINTTTDNGTDKLQVNGNIISNGSVTASSFIKSGGTSSQLLAADGSVVTAGTNVTISGGTISASGAATSGRYLPTITNQYGTSLISTDSAMYVRNGNIVEVSVWFSATVTSSTANYVNISLPVASDIANGTDVIGTGSTNGFSATYPAVYVDGDASDNSARASVWPPSSSSCNWFVTFKYIIR